jgi:Mn-dependent DtxR family transcriptional regulator
VYNVIGEEGIPGVRRIGKRIKIHRPTVLEWFRKGQGAVPRSRRKP